MRAPTSACFGAIIAVTLVILQFSTSVAGQAKQSTAAPVPAQILTAKKVFICNGGGDEMAENDPIFSGGPDRAYNEFYAGVKSWNRFEIVDSPSAADLLLLVRQEVLTVSLGGKAGASDTPLFHLEIRDPRTNALLWGFHVHGEFGLGQGNSDRNFDQAVDRLLNDLRTLGAGQPGPSAAARP